MSTLTASGRAAVADLARRYGLSEDAVEQMARAVANGGGTMAQFNVPELGGSGQWMAGGMTMVGDMFNTGLQNTVSNLCGEISNAMAAQMFFEPVKASGLDGVGGIGGIGGGWPDWLGSPASSGGQNQARYAYFPAARRLAFDYGDGRAVVLLDTGDHQIGGFSQQQSGPGDPFLGVSVSSQFGQFALSSFPVVEGVSTVATGPGPAAEPQPQPEPAPVVADPPAASVPATANEILATIEGLAKLRDMGALTEAEFGAKKAELLARL